MSHLYHNFRNLYPDSMDASRLTTTGTTETSLVSRLNQDELRQGYVEVRV